MSFSFFFVFFSSFFSFFCSYIFFNFSLFPVSSLMFLFSFTFSFSSYFLSETCHCFSFLVFLSRSGSWPFLLEVRVALPVGVGPSFFAPFFVFLFSFFIVSSIFDARRTISTTPAKDEGTQHNPKGNGREGQILPKRGGGEGQAPP